MTSDVREHKIVVMGGGGVGKSSLTIRLVTDNFLDEYDPTIEDSYRKQVIIDNKPALLDILDTAGQEEFDSMQDQWIREGDAFLLVYSITSIGTYDKCITLREKILRTKDEDKQCPIVLVGNKCDLEDQRQIETAEAQKTAQDWKCKFFECSAKSRINNELIFYECVREIRRIESGKKDDDKPEKKKKKGCIIL